MRVWINSGASGGGGSGGGRGNDGGRGRKDAIQKTICSSLQSVECAMVTACSVMCGAVVY
ncbi:hypothetical protein E2C01_031038 [Portunus trituberculatus]|uniref:Uncharacterized protein n=1 Tax=Portunus trituberculatus TaxID=210409 RepID=A0A5B7ETF7_PORTR|nr:hypothetical protein [Portunus trituberculatus]